jgi:hypothetical protein
LSQADLAQIDVAEVNLACAEGLPGAEKVDMPNCLRTLDEWAKQVERETQRVRPQFERSPEDFNHSWAFFRVLALVTVLQRDIGIRYNPQLIERDDFFNDASNLFVHGVIDTHQGTCSSLPPLYVAVGRRLGYRLKLVTTSSHLFARWDDPDGERFNIECTSLGLNSYADDYYLSWPVKADPSDVDAFHFLQSFSPKEDLAAFLACRGHCLLQNGDHRSAAHCYAWASTLARNNELPQRALAATLGRWRKQLSSLLPPPWPRVQIAPGLTRFAGLPWEADGAIIHLELLETLSRDPDFVEAYQPPIASNRRPGRLAPNDRCAGSCPITYSRLEGACDVRSQDWPLALARPARLRGGG